MWYVNETAVSCRTGWWEVEEERRALGPVGVVSQLGRGCPNSEGRDGGVRRFGRMVCPSLVAAGSDVFMGVCFPP